MNALKGYSQVTQRIVNHWLETHAFTDLQREILPLVIAGYSYDEIAQVVKCSKKTAEQHVSRILKDGLEMDGGRATLLRFLFEELDSEIREVEAVMEREKQRRGLHGNSEESQSDHQTTR